MGLEATGPGPRSTDNGRPLVADLQGDGYYAQFARKHWLKPSKVTRIKPDALKTELWDVLEGEDFQSKSLLILENLQILEDYLWPAYTDDSSNHHVFLIALIVNVKARENLPIWSSFSEKSTEFSSLFRRILSMTLETSLSPSLRTYLLSFIISAFQSLDSGLVRKECAPLVSISIWHNLVSDAAREGRFKENGQLRKAWRAAAKRYDAADEPTKAKIRFERSWLYTMILNFLNRLYEPTQQPIGELYLRLSNGSPC